MILRGLSWLRREYRSRRDPIAFARSIGVTIGEDCWFLATSVATWGSEPYLVTLGNHVTVTAGVRFITHDGSVGVFRQEHPDLDLFGPIAVGSNVFLGIGAILLPGVTVGDDSVVGAGSIVNRDVPTRSIVAGVPARVICSIDDYWRKHESKFMHTHRLPPDEKRRVLLAHFGRRSR